MKHIAILQTVLAISWISLAQQITLNGRVVDKSGHPLAGVDVTLAGQGLTVTTGANGMYAFDAPLERRSLQARPRPQTAVFMRNGLLCFTVESSRIPVSLTLYDCNGRSLGRPLHKTLDAGRYTLDPRALLARQSFAQVQLLRLCINGSVTTLRHISSCKAAQPASPPVISTQLQKMSATVDSLVLDRPAYLTRRVAIESFTASRNDDTLWSDSLPRTVRSTGDSANGDIIFYTIDGNGSRMLISHARNDDDTVAYCALFEDAACATQGAIMYTRNFIPVQWVVPAYNLKVYRLDPDIPFDPHAAFHAMGPDTTSQEDTATLDIGLTSLASLSSELRDGYGPEFKAVDTFLQRYALTTFEALVARARKNGDDQHIFMNMALSFSTAHAALMLKRQAGLGKRAIIGGDAAFKIIIKLGARAAANAALDGLRDELDPKPGGIGILLCQGAAKYGVCHYRFFFSNPTPTGAIDPQVVGRCMNFCRVTMGCFTNICMPMDLAEATGGFGGNF